MAFASGGAAGGAGPALDGASVTNATYCNHGGGGGACGYIRINTHDAASVQGTLSPAQSSGAATTGPLQSVGG